MTNDPVGLRRTTLNRDDAAAMLALAHAYDAAFFGEPMMDLEDVLSELDSPGFDLDRDSVAFRTGDGALVAYATLNSRAQVDVEVAADWQPTDLRITLQAFAESKARERGFDAIDQYVARDDAAGATFLRERGYALHHTAWILQLASDQPIAGRELPAGYAVRPFTAADAEATFAVITRAFGEWEDGPERTFGDWAVRTVGRPGADPGTFRVATFAGELIGASIVFDSGDEAWVAQLAVAKEHRGRGVAQQLLAETYQAARERGVPKAGLATDTRTGALDLYLRLGMVAKHTVDNWSRALT